MAQDSANLIWIDLEMSGLRPEADTILEVALVVTSQELQVIAEGPVRAVHQSDSVLDGMDNWNKSTHARSGLTERVRLAGGSLDHHAGDGEFRLRAWLPWTA